MTSNGRKPVLYDYFDRTADVLQAEYKRSKLQKSSPNLGDNRELFCAKFLSGVLPPRLSIRKGEIWDGQGHRTEQLDTVILRDDTPSLTFGDTDSYLVEGVFSVIEVKSNLKREKLCDAIANLRPVKSLIAHKEGLSILGMPIEYTLEKPLCCVFAYEGATWETLADEMQIQNGWEVIDLICVLNRGALIRNGLWFREDGVLFHMVNSKAASLGMLYFHLSTFASNFIARNISIRPYFEPFEGWNDSGKWIVAKLKS